MMSAMHRDIDTGAVTEIKLLLDMSAVIFQQDGAPTHTSKKTQVGERTFKTSGPKVFGLPTPLT